MTDETTSEERSKKERSPAYPFISLRKAVERAEALYERHRREPARLSAIAPTWNYGLKSSGLQQTVGALKQFGLIEDSGSGDDRKVQVSELARKILVDQRPGAKEEALREAALKPRLIAEYARWFRDRPSDSHCISELIFDRGFNEAAAIAFLRSFDETVEYAHLGNGDSLSLSQTEDEQVVTSPQSRPAVDRASEFQSKWFSPRADLPLGQRVEVKLNGDGHVTVQALLISPAEIDWLVRALAAHKTLLEPLSDANGS